MFRVIFDRSAFHEDRFDSIQSSALLDLYRKGRIAVFHTPVFLNETLSAYGAGDRAKQWQQHLSFCLDVCSGLFLDRDEIWHNELVAGRGPHARYLYPERPNKRYQSRSQLIEMLREKAETGDVSRLRAQTCERKRISRKTISEQFRPKSDRR